MEYLAYGQPPPPHQQPHYADPMPPSAVSTINTNDYGDMAASPPFTGYQENSNSNNSNSNPSPPLGSGGAGSGSDSHSHYQHHAPYALKVARYDEKSSKKGYVVDEKTKKLQLTHGPPKYSKRGGGAGVGPPAGPSSHDKAIIGQYRKEMRKEGVQMQGPNSYHQNQQPSMSNTSFQFGAARTGADAGDEDGTDKPPPKKRKPKKQSQFQQAKSELQKRLQEKDEFTKKKKAQKAEVGQAQLNRKQKRLERNKIQTQVTAKGQPLMKGRILNLLSKLEGEQQQ